MALDLLEVILPHIRNSIYRQRLSLPDWKMKEGDVEHAASPSLNDKNWTPIRIPFQWGKYDKTFWFRQTVEVPSSFAGKPLALLLQFPEAQLYLNGKPYQGLDAHHTEVFLTSRARTAEAFHVAVEAYSGRKKDQNTFATAELVTVDSDARRLHSALTVLHELDKLLEHGSSESKDIREIIRRTLVFLKYFKPESDAYPGQIARAYRELQAMLENEYRTTVPGLIHLIGHSHIDVAWLWTFRETVRKCGRTFSTALRLLEEFPEFKFTQSQALLYQFTRDTYPDLYRQIKQRVLEGRWEVTGAMWVEPDCNIPSGESLVRQLVHGKRFFREEFNHDCTVVWLPDTFGFTWSLPQLMKKAGVSFFHTSKLSWNDTNPFPHSTFWWEGVDGTRILSHVSPVGLEGQAHPKDLLKSAGALPRGPSEPDWASVASSVFRKR
jgi:alpha-mannosidase